MKEVTFEEVIFMFVFLGIVCLVSWALSYINTKKKYKKDDYDNFMNPIIVLFATLCLSSCSKEIPDGFASFENELTIVLWIVGDAEFTNREVKIRELNDPYRKHGINFTIKETNLIYYFNTSIAK